MHDKQVSGRATPKDKKPQAGSRPRVARARSAAAAGADADAFTEETRAKNLAERRRLPCRAPSVATQYEYPTSGMSKTACGVAIQKQKQKQKQRLLHPRGSKR